MGLVLCAYGAASYPCPNPTRTHAVISVTAWSDNTTVYYDHWENGYDFDPANPTTADETYTHCSTPATASSSRAPLSPFRGNATHPAPQPSCDHASPRLRSTGPTAPTASQPLGATTCYDGGDRIYVAGGVVTVTRVGWIEDGAGAGPSRVQAAWEIYPVKPQLTTYVVPVRREPVGCERAFSQRVPSSIQATAEQHDDHDRPRTATAPRTRSTRTATRQDSVDGDLHVTLQAGQTFLLDDQRMRQPDVRRPGTLNAGSVIQGSSTLQVKYITGQPRPDTTARAGFSAFPRGFWTKDYYAAARPADEHGERATRTTTSTTRTGARSPSTGSRRTASGRFTIPANTAVSFRTASGGTVPVGSGLYFSGTRRLLGRRLERRRRADPRVGLQPAALHDALQGALPRLGPGRYPPAAGRRPDMGALPHRRPGQHHGLRRLQQRRHGRPDLHPEPPPDAVRLSTPPTGTSRGRTSGRRAPFTMAYGAERATPPDRALPRWTSATWRFPAPTSSPSCSAWTSR